MMRPIHIFLHLRFNQIIRCETRRLTLAPDSSVGLYELVQVGLWYTIALGLQVVVIMNNVGQGICVLRGQPLVLVFKVDLGQREIKRLHRTAHSSFCEEKNIYVRCEIDLNSLSNPHSGEEEKNVYVRCEIDLNLLPNPHSGEEEKNVYVRCEIDLNSLPNPHSGEEEKNVYVRCEIDLNLLPNPHSGEEEKNVYVRCEIDLNSLSNPHSVRRKTYM